MRYALNLLKLLNRGTETFCGGHPEVPISARTGYWLLKGYRRGRVLNALINFLFQDPKHCENAYLKEDDSLVKYAADPEGNYLIPLLALTMGLYAFVGYSVGVTVWSFIKPLLG